MMPVWKTSTLWEGFRDWKRKEVLLKMGEKVGTNCLCRILLRLTSSKQEEGGFFFPQGPTSEVIPTVKINTGSCENHLYGQKSHYLVSSSDSHWKEGSREDVKPWWQPQGWLTGPHSSSYLPAVLGFTGCNSDSLDKSRGELKRCCCYWTDSSTAPLILWEPTSSWTKSSSNSWAGQKDSGLPVWLTKYCQLGSVE